MALREQCRRDGCTNVVVAGSATDWQLLIAVRTPQYAEATARYCSKPCLVAGGHTLLDSITDDQVPGPG